MEIKDQKKKPKDDGKTDAPSETMSLGDQWRNAQRDANMAREAFEAKERIASDLGSQVAKKLIDEKGGAPIPLDGVQYTPKKSPTRKGADGQPKAPEFPYMLAKKGDKAPVADI